LMHMFTNKDVDAVMCVRGGYGSIRILNLLDFEKIKRIRKSSSVIAISLPCYLLFMNVPGWFVFTAHGYFGL